MDTSNMPALALSECAERNRLLLPNGFVPPDAPSPARGGIKYRTCIVDEEQMPFSAENQRWIADQIDAAINRAFEKIRPPGGFKKFVFFLREWSLLAANFGFILTLGIFALTQYSAANKRLVEDAETHTKVNDKLASIEEKLNGLRALIASSQPERKENQDAAKQLLAEAKARSIPPLSESTVVQAGTSFFDVSKENPRAWSVFLGFVSYRSSLNTPLPNSKMPVLYLSIPDGPTSYHQFQARMSQYYGSRQISVFPVRKLRTSKRLAVI